MEVREGEVPPPLPHQRQFVDLEIECVDDDGEEVESPPIRYFFPKPKKVGGGAAVAKRWWGAVLKAMAK